MPTVHEILRQSGFSQEQIEALDARAITAFGSVLTTAEGERTTATTAQAKAEADFKAAQEAVAKAEQTRQEAIAEKEKAELQYRSNVEFYDTKVVPGLTGWDEEKLKLENARIKAEAEAAFYRTQIQGAKDGGFVPLDAPGYKAAEPDPTRDGNGRYVAGGNGTPGSPTYLDPVKLAAQFSDKAAMLGNIEWKYRKLYNDVMPIAPSQLIAEADAQKLDPAVYAEKRFNFAGREQELNTQRQAERDAKLQADAAAVSDATWKAKMDAREAEFAAKEKQRAEQAGSNPDVRMPAGSSKFTDLKRAEVQGEIKSPLKMTDAERRQQTRKMIHAEIDAREGAVA